MDLDYFNQDEYYFSESQGQLIRIDEMPFQQAFFSHRKLIREYGLDAYAGTPLFQVFIRKLCPTPAEIREQVEKFGKACHAIYDPGMMAKTNGTAVRSKFYKALRKPGTRVKTHVVDTSVGSYIECTIPVSLRVKGTAV